ncbi:MAG: hypothetical protein LBH43_17910 [Treponema sp.]|jgi:hypothetical protein|nr:hypothetical protein [Treponema sp.]
MMNKKNLPQLITVVSFVVLMVLGQACATISQEVLNAASIDDLTRLRDKFAWLDAKAESGGNYVVEVYEDSSLGSMSTYAVFLSYKGRSNITVTLRGVGGRRTITTYQKGGIFVVDSGVTFILDENIQLQGVSRGNAIDKLNSVVHVNPGGTFIMNDGSGIADNMSYQNGGGVYVANDGTFLMKGGVIERNYCYQIQDQALVMSTGGRSNTFAETPRRGGGVYVSVGGTFTKTGGTITGYASDPRNGNTTRTFNNLEVSRNNGHAVFAALGRLGTSILGPTVSETGSKRKETTAGPDVNLHISSDGTFSGNWDF